VPVELVPLFRPGPHLSPLVADQSVFPYRPCGALRIIGSCRRRDSIPGRLVMRRRLYQLVYDGASTGTHRRGWQLEGRGRGLRRSGGRPEGRVPARDTAAVQRQIHIVGGRVAILGQGSATRAHVGGTERTPRSACAAGCCHRVCGPRMRCPNPRIRSPCVRVSGAPTCVGVPRAWASAGVRRRRVDRVSGRRRPTYVGMSQRAVWPRDTMRSGAQVCRYIWRAIM
jgi:hypothetical protein